MDLELAALLFAALSDFEHKAGSSLLSLVVSVRDPSSSVNKTRRVKVKSNPNYVRVRESIGVTGLMLADSLRSIGPITVSEVTENLLIPTGDLRFFLKTIKRDDFAQLEARSGRYFEYISTNPSSLLVRMVGCYKATIYGSLRKVKRMMVVMENVFCKEELTIERFDLKGSKIGRMSLDGGVGKDVNFRQKGKKIALGDSLKPAFLEQVNRDVAFLQAEGLFDYSLLVGISQEKSVWEAQELPNSRYLHVSEDGRWLYFMAIIDLGSRYSSGRHLENAAKTLIFEGEEISCVPPDRYAERFLAAVELAIE